CRALQKTHELKHSAGGIGSIDFWRRPLLSDEAAKKEGVRDQRPFPLWRLRSGPFCDAHRSKIFGSGIPIMSPPGPNTWTLNIQPLDQFRPHRGFLLARSTLPGSVARLPHTAGQVACLLRRFVDE